MPKLESFIEKQLSISQNSEKKEEKKSILFKNKNKAHQIIHPQEVFQKKWFEEVFNWVFKWPACVQNRRSEQMRGSILIQLVECQLRYIYYKIKRVF